MYVCICNAVTEDAVHECLASGARNTREVKESCGMKPACGTCTRRIRTMVSEWRTASEPMDSITDEPLHARPKQQHRARKVVKQPAA
ncbi:(2Fe-2S)-binding protein [Actinocorallia sp. B10E7]|uniref:(2Fe-2S)-binding protein n=1 Tax=Actinocorallia sp. B10E7 TaxID=3153558 RepID=UPI00325F7C28